MSDYGFKSRSIGVNRSTTKKQRQRSANNGVGNRVSGMFFALLARVRKPRTRRQKLMMLGKALGIGGAAGLLFLAVLWLTLPNIDDPRTMFPSQSTVILDRNGIELYRLFSEEDRTYITGDGVGEYVKKATIAIEDERFFSRSTCFDVIGITRAAFSQIAPSFFVRSGGSTLTQQFAGNAMVGRKRSIIRKVRELMLSCQLERKYNKDELLELYLNWIPYGQNAYGIEQAAKNYFASSAKELSLAESAILAALPQRPSYFNPYGSRRHTIVADEVMNRIARGEITSVDEIPSSAMQIGLIGANAGSGSQTVYIGGRTDQVLRNMLDQGMISLEEHDEAISELSNLTFERERQNIRAPHFVLGIQEQVEELLGIDERFLQQGGFRITTTLNWRLQEEAEKVIAARRDDIRTRFGAHNIALVSMSPVTREVLAYVGNADFSDDEHQGKIDMAVAPRQPGSSFKAFTYLAAFEAGWGPGSVTYDVPTKFGSDTPQNFSGDFWGLMSMRSALAASRNIPAIKAFFLAGGEDALLSLATRVGVVSPAKQKSEFRSSNPDFDYGWPLAIGSAETPLYEMVQGYATIADGGNFRLPHTIMKITDKDDAVLYLPKQDVPRQVVDERAAAQLTSVLSDTGARPNEYWQSILSVPGVESAAKTGTSNKCLERDDTGGCTLRRPESTWTIGFTPNLITGVWVGNATSQSLFHNADGLTTAAPIWHDYMAAAHKKLENVKTQFVLPSGLSRPLISKLSGELASPCTPINMQTTDLFTDERIPSREDPACEVIEVDKVTGLLASPACPADAVEERSFFVPQSELPDRWPTWEEGVREWAAKQMLSWSATDSHSGSALPLPVAPTDSCDPALTPGRLTKPTVSITSPSAGAAVPYPVFQPSVRVQSEAGIREVSYAVDGKSVKTFTESPFSGPVRVPRSVGEEGTHTLTVTVSDMYYNTVSADVSFRFGRDASAPQVRFTSPGDGTTVTSGTPIIIRANASDDGGIEYVQFYLDATLLTTKRSEPYELNFTLDVEPGPHLLRVVAKDSANNEASDEIVITVEP